MRFRRRPHPARSAPWLALGGALLGAALAALWWRGRGEGLGEGGLDLDHVLGDVPEGVGIHDLGEGFVELVGEVGSWEVADDIERRIALVPGIHGVVNRIWID